MAAKYGKIIKTFWKHPKVRGLREENQELEADKLLAYIYTNEHTNIIGFYRLDKFYICADLDITMQRLHKPFTQLLTQRFIFYDETVRYLMIPDWFEHNPICNPKQCDSALSAIDDLPQTTLLQHLDEWLKPLDKRYTQRFTQRLHKRFHDITVTVT